MSQQHRRFRTMRGFRWSAQRWRNVGLGLALTGMLCGFVGILSSASEGFPDAGHLLVAAGVTLYGYSLALVWPRLRELESSQGIADAGYLSSSAIAEAPLRRPDAPEHDGELASLVAYRNRTPFLQPLVSSSSAEEAYRTALPSEYVEPAGHYVPYLGRAQPSPAAMPPPIIDHEFRAPALRPPNDKVELLWATKARKEQKVNPFVNEPLFSLDRPVGNLICHNVPRDPEMPSEDGYAFQLQRRVYAVTDGVSQSFVAAPWARIVARSYVANASNLQTPDQFSQWLTTCSNQWYEWMKGVWIPTIENLRYQRGDFPRDWHEEMARKGAQTTLVGCSLSLAPDGGTEVRVVAIGDSEFFLFQQVGYQEWQLQDAFPINKPTAFDNRPMVLSTLQSSAPSERAWQGIQFAKYVAYPGDRIVLASDSIAKWLLRQAQQGPQRWQKLLTTSDPAWFTQFVYGEWDSGQMEEDDVTLMVIPIS